MHTIINIINLTVRNSIISLVVACSYACLIDKAIDNRAALKNIRENIHGQADNCENHGRLSVKGFVVYTYGSVRTSYLLKNLN